MNAGLIELRRRQIFADLTTTYDSGEFLVVTDLLRDLRFWRIMMVGDSGGLVTVSTDSEHPLPERDAHLDTQLYGGHNKSNHIIWGQRLWIYLKVTAPVWGRVIAAGDVYAVYQIDGMTPEDISALKAIITADFYAA